MERPAGNFAAGDEWCTVRFSMVHEAGNFSEQLWGLELSAHLPLALVDDVTLEAASTEDVLRFVGAHYATIFAATPDDSRFLPEQMNAAKRRFLEASDKLAFREHGQLVGVLIGNPVDWSTYYWRTVGFLPEHQGRGLLAAALSITDPIMQSAGIERIEGDAAPANYRQVRLLLRLGYCITGSNNSERWGAMLRLTRFLNPEGHRVFTKQFCKDPDLPGPPGPVNDNREGGHHEEVRNRHVLSDGGASIPQVLL